MKRLWSWFNLVQSSACNRRRPVRTSSQVMAPTLERLEDRMLLTNSLGFSTIADVTLRAGSPLMIPLDGFDTEGRELSFSATSSDGSVTTSIADGNRSLKIDVTGFGTMVFQLFEDRVPGVTDHIIELAESGYYDGVIFHRVIDTFVIQGGDRTGTGSGGSSLGAFDDLFDVDLQHNRTGLLSMAKSYDDTNDSQFFITEGAQRHLDFQHSIFGVLVEGESVREAISNVPVNSENNSYRPISNVTMSNVDVIVDRQNRVLMLKAPEGMTGATDITVTATDDLGNTYQQTFHVTVQPDNVNSNPYLAPIPDIYTAVNTPVEFQLQAIDVEGGLIGGQNVYFLDQHVLNDVELYVPVQAHPDLAYVVDIETGLTTIAPQNGLTGTYTFTVAVGVDTKNIDYQVVTVHILSELPAPQGTGPGAMTIDTTPTFTWNAVGGAASYDIWVNDLTTGQTAVIRNTAVAGTSYSPTTPLIVGHEYLWTVRANSSTAEPGLWATHRSFKVVPPDSIAGPQIQGPMGSQLDATPTFQWTAVSGAAVYDIWVNDQTTGQSGVIRVKDVAGTTFTPTVDLVSGHSYLWTVRALNDQGVAGTWATHQTFYVAAGPSILSPGTQSDSLRPKFAWQPLSGVQSYEIRVNDATMGQSDVMTGTAIEQATFTPTTDLVGGHRYTWQVRAVDTDGNAGAWSTMQSVTIAPTLTTPIGKTVDTTPTFKWTEVDGAVRYDLWVNDQTTGQSGVIRKTTLSEATFTPTTPLTVGHSYIWTVRAFYGDDTSSMWAGYKTYSIAMPTDVAPPSLTEGMGTTSDTTPTFNWTAVNGAAMYDLWINDLTTGQVGIIRQKTLTTTSFTPTTPLPLGHQFVWTVRAINDEGVAGDWSVHQTLSLDFGAPQQQSLSGTTVDATPTFQWSAVEGAVRYDLWVNNQSTGQVGVIRNTNVTETHFTPTTALGTGQRFIWAVRAFNSDGVAGEWSNFRVFEIGNLPAPTLTGPKSTTTADSTPTFEWSAVAGAAKYDIWVNDLTTGVSGIIRNMNVTDASFTPTELLPMGHDFVWTVRAINDDGAPGEWAAAVDFSIQPLSAPVATTPVANTTITKPTFGWQQISGAVTYELSVRDLTASGTEVVRKTDITGGSFKIEAALVVGHQYEWVVRAVNGDGVAGAWSEAKSFTLQKLGVPALQVPSNTVTTLKPFFQWTPVTGAVQYDLWVNDVTTGQVGVIRVTDVQSNNFQPTTPLINGHTYVWTVRAINSNGDTGEWATNRQFNIQTSQLETVPIRLRDNSSSPAVNESEQIEQLLETIPVEHPEEGLLPTTAHEAILVAESDSGTDHHANGEPTALPNPTLIPNDSPSLDIVAVNHVDTVMVDWAETDWWLESQHDADATDRRSLSEVKTAPSTASTVLLGIGLPLAVNRTWRRWRRRRAA